MESIKEKFEEIVKKAKKNKLAGRIKHQSLFELVEEDLANLVIEEAKGPDASSQYAKQITELIENKFGIKIDKDYTPCYDYFRDKGIEYWDVNDVDIDITPRHYRKIFPINGRYENIEHIVLSVYWVKKDVKYSLHFLTETAKVSGLVFEICQVDTKGGKTTCCASVGYTEDAQYMSSYVRGRLLLKDNVDIDFRKVGSEINQKFKNGAVELSYVSEVIAETKEKYKAYIL